MPARARRHTAKPPAPRQVVVLMTDSQRWDMLGCYGTAGIRTPNLDRLAAQGMRFERAYCCQPVCGPARAALFTGTYPHANGSWANCLPLGDNVPTLGQRGRDEGLQTGYIGKWHLDGGDYFGLGRCPDGWHPGYWYDMRNYLDELTPRDRVRSRRTDTNGEGVDAPFTFAHRCSNRAIAFLEEFGGDDFLLVVSYDEPHDPYLCPPEYWQAYRDYRLPGSANLADPLTDKPDHQRAWAGPRLAEPAPATRAAAADYLGCNSFVDHELGRVLTTLDRYAPDALVVYTSDHGEFLGSHRLHGKGPAAYDEIARVPLLVRWPGHVEAGSVCAHPVSHIDLMPTLMEALGAAVPPLLDGTSLLPALADPSLRVRDAAFIEFGRYEVDHDGFGGFQPLRAACDGRHKLVVNLLTTDELYDLEADPEEMTNLIESPHYTQVRNELHDQLLAWMNNTRDPFRGYHWERRPWRPDARPASWEYTGMTRQRQNEEYEPRQLDYSTGLEMREAVRRKQSDRPGPEPLPSV
jgi:uncharacterized sulfatase